jgi:GH25 family lysozyme M1 (1,4-beta-N-acetylmuramidase)
MPVLGPTAAVTATCFPSHRSADKRRFISSGLVMTAAAFGLATGAPSVLAQRPQGIDVSHYQGAITWSSVKGAGIVFAWAKATEGGTNYFSDPNFAGNESGAKAAGVLIGGYHFARYDLDQGTAGAAAEAGWFWQKAGAYLKNDGASLMPMLDLEGIPISGTTYNPNHWGYTKTTFSQWANSYCTTLSNYAYTAGVIIRPVIYTSSSFGNSWLDSTTTNWIPWIAAWNGQNPQTGGPSGNSPWPTWNVWQYTDAASVSGISGAVDGDVFNGTAASLAAMMVIGSGMPSITNQPLGQVVTLGSNVTFTVGATGAPPLAYQWRFNSTNIAAATLSTYTRYNVQLADAGSYTVKVSSSSGSVTSTVATLTVVIPPSVLLAPSFTADGWFHANLVGAPGQSYVIEGSSNLSDWSPLQTNTSPFTFSDTNAANLPMQFYRAHLVQ